MVCLVFRSSRSNSSADRYNTAHENEPLTPITAFQKGGPREFLPWLEFHSRRGDLPSILRLAQDRLSSGCTGSNCARLEPVQPSSAPLRFVANFYFFFTRTIESALSHPLVDRVGA